MAKDLIQVNVCSLRENKAEVQLIIHEGEWLLSQAVPLVLEFAGCYPKKGFVMKPESEVYWSNLAPTTPGYSSYLKNVYKVIAGPPALRGKLVYGL